MTAKTEKPGPAPIRCPTALLLESQELAGYQRDFAGVLLTGPDYTIQEAKGILDKFFKGGGC